MGKYSGYLICTDLDGTFVDDRGELIERNLKAVEEYMQEGGLFTVATGRTGSYIREYYKGRIKINTYLVCLNGTMIYDTEKEEIVYSNVMKKDKMDGVKEYVDGCLCAYIYTANNLYHKIEDVPVDADIYKIVFVYENEEKCLEMLCKMKEKYGEDFDFNRSYKEFLEMENKGSGKGDAVRQMRTLLGENAKKVVCFGDFENDLTMIEEADMGVAVGNALPSLKEIADKVTVSNNEGAIAEIISEL